MYVVNESSQTGPNSDNCHHRHRGRNKNGFPVVMNAHLKLHETTHYGVVLRILRSN